MEDITNVHILDKERKEGLKTCIVWLNSLTDTSVPETTIRSLINGIIKEFKSLLKSTKKTGFSEKIQIFEMKKYVFPNRQSNPRKKNLILLLKILQMRLTISEYEDSKRLK